jgi:Acyl-CoA dehydrogenases
VTALPADLYDAFSLLPEDERAVLVELRGMLERDVAPLLDEHWESGTFPDAIIEPLVSRRLMDPPTLAGREPSELYAGMRNLELARVDASVATFYNAQSGLFRTTILRGGSPEQAAAWDPLVRSFDLTGVFALTEPDHGSDIARGIATTCRRDRDAWVLDGRKRWIGGASHAQRLVVFARDDSGAVRAFLVDREATGVTLTKIQRKTSLRIMQNFDIELDGVRVADEWRLGGISSFADVADCLRAMRSDVAWIATGAAAGAYESALRYTLAREQFGQPIAGFQLVQERLARMLGLVTASVSLVVRLTQQQTRGVYRDEDSALAKMVTSANLRETVALAREVCGGNGITLDTGVARFHADAEAIYSYEGTHDINSLIVGRAVTGIGAFVRSSPR